MFNEVLPSYIFKIDIVNNNFYIMLVGFES